jgi:hypothetical protein
MKPPRRVADCRLYGGLFLLLFCLAACNGKSSTEPSSELAEIRTVLEKFHVMAYNEAGDVGAAYALLDTSSRATCPRTRFERMAEIARSVLGSHALKVEAIGNVEITGDMAILNLELSGDDLSPPFFPRTATLRREQGEWRYVISTDPSCQSVFRFFGLTPGPQVTPSIWDDPTCEPSYPSFCIPAPPPDLDCEDIEEEKPFAVDPPDPHGFDTDGDGFGCEENQPGDR